MSDTNEQANDNNYHLVLFVDGLTQTSRQAIERIRNICDQELQNDVTLEVVDVHQNPQRVADEDIIAVPTLLRKLPAPLRVAVGDMSRQKLLLAIEWDAP